MATLFKKDQIVRVKAVVPTGPVVKFHMDEDTGEVQYLLQWVDALGDLQERWFREDELEVAPT